MGQVYSIVAEFKIPQGKEDAFCRTMRHGIASQEFRKGAKFDHSKGDDSTPLGCFKIITSEWVDERDGQWIAAMAASYSWGDVMYEIFRDAVAMCDNGTSVRIEAWDDDSTVVLTKENGMYMATWS